MSVRQRLKKLEQAAARVIEKRQSSPTAADAQLEAFRELSLEEMRVRIQEEVGAQARDGAAIQAFRALPIEEMLPALQREMNREFPGQGGRLCPRNTPI